MTSGTKSSPSLSILAHMTSGLSIFCLFLSFVTFVSLGNMRSGCNTIHANFVACLALAQLLFVVGMDVLSYSGACSLIAGFLHYLFLTSFYWLLAEGLHIFASLTSRFHTSQTMPYVYIPLGYVTPALIVAGALFLSRQDYGSVDCCCWVKTSKSFEYVYYVPAFFVIIANLSLLVFTMFPGAHKQHISRKERQTFLDLVRVWTETMVLCILLSTTWVVAYFYFSTSGTIVYGYVFFTLLGLQGVFVFSFHCLANKMVCKEYLRVLEKATWMPGCCRSCLVKLFSLPSDPTNLAAEITINVHLADDEASRKTRRNTTFNKKQSASQKPASKHYLSVTGSLPSDVHVANAMKMKSSFETIEVEMPSVSSTLLADADIYLGDDYGDVYGADITHIRPRESSNQSRDAQPANRPEDGAEGKGTDGKPALEAAQPKESAAAASAAVHQVGQSPEPKPVLPTAEQPGQTKEQPRPEQVKEQSPPKQDENPETEGEQRKRDGDGNIVNEEALQGSCSEDGEELAPLSHGLLSLPEGYDEEAADD